MPKTESKKIALEMIERNRNEMKRNDSDPKTREYYRGQAAAIAGYAFVLDILTEKEFVEITNKIWG